MISTIEREDFQDKFQQAPISVSSRYGVVIQMTRNDPRMRRISLLRQVLQEVATWENLEDNWDGEGAKPIGARALAVARFVLEDLSEMGVASASPTHTGGILLELAIPVRANVQGALMIDIFSSGDMQYCVLDDSDILEEGFMALPQHIALGVAS